MYGFKPQHARGKPVQNFADGGLVNPLAGVGEYWSNSNAEFEAQNPNLLQRGVRAINPVTGFGSAVGAMHDGASVGSARDMAIAAMQAVPVFGAMRAVAPAVKTVAGAAPAVLVPSMAKTAARGAKGAAAGVAADEAQVQNFADGGIVHSIKGALGFRPRTPEELRAADAKSQARNQEAAAAVAERNRKTQPAPQQQSAVSGYAGMSAMQRREKELGLKDGGLVPRGFKPGGLIRGPGTGTSDSIETEKEPGTFIMPADSTEAIGPDALEDMGEKVPVRLSNGEFEVPPEQVQALGEAVLTVMRDATHKTVDAAGAGALDDDGPAQPQAFAGGGAVEDQATAALRRARGFQVPGSSGAMAIEDSIAGRRASMQAGEALRGIGQGVASLFRKPEQAQPAMPAITNPTDARLAAGTQRAPAGFAPAIKPQVAAAPTVPQQAPVTAPVQRMAQQPQAPAFDFDNYQPAPGQGAFRNEQTGEVTRLQDGPSPTRDTRIWKEPNVLPRSDARPAAPRQDVRAPVLNPNGGVFAAMADFTNQTGDAVNAIAANKGARNDRKDDLDQTRVDADIAATGARLSLDGQRVGLDAQRIAQGGEANRIAGEELSMRREAAGFQTRAAKRLEDLQASYQSAKTPEERAGIAQQLRELQGKADTNLRNNFMTAGGGQEWDAQAGVMRNVPQRLVDLRTGMEVGSPQAPALPKGMKRQIGTSNGRPVYEDMNGKQVIAKG